jgi:hypothetical protein
VVVPGLPLRIKITSASKVIAAFLPDRDPGHVRFVDRHVDAHPASDRSVT